MVISLCLMLIIGLQSCAVGVGGSILGEEDLSQGGSVGIFIALLYIIGAAFSIGKPIVSTIVFGIAAFFAFTVGVTTSFSDMKVWSFVSLVLSILSYFGQKELQKKNPPQEEDYDYIQKKSDITGKKWSLNTNFSVRPIIENIKNIQINTKYLTRISGLIVIFIFLFMTCMFIYHKSPELDEQSSYLKLLSLNAELDNDERYIVGTIKNTAEKSYGYALISFDLFDSSNKHIENAYACTYYLKAGNAWNFKALIIEDNAIKYKVKNIIGLEEDMVLDTELNIKPNNVTTTTSTDNNNYIGATNTDIDIDYKTNKTYSKINKTLSKVRSYVKRR